MRQLSGAIVQSSQDPANRDLDSPCHIDNDKGDVCDDLTYLYKPHQLRYRESIDWPQFSVREL